MKDFAKWVRDNQWKAKEKNNKNEVEIPLNILLQTWTSVVGSSLNSEIITP